jgi:hypothetical protein
MEVPFPGITSKPYPRFCASHTLYPLPGALSQGSATLPRNGMDSAPSFITTNWSPPLLRPRVIDSADLEHLQAVAEEDSKRLVADYNMNHSHINGVAKPPS